MSGQSGCNLRRTRSSLATGLSSCSFLPLFRHCWWRWARGCSRMWTLLTTLPGLSNSSKLVCLSSSLSLPHPLSFSLCLSVCVSLSRSLFLFLFLSLSPSPLPSFSPSLPPSAFLSFPPPLCFPVLPSRPAFSSLSLSPSLLPDVSFSVSLYAGLLACTLLSLSPSLAPTYGLLTSHVSRLTSYVRMSKNKMELDKKNYNKERIRLGSGSTQKNENRMMVCMDSG